MRMAKGEEEEWLVRGRVRKRNGWYGEG